MRSICASFEEKPIFSLSLTIPLGQFEPFGIIEFMNNDGSPSELYKKTPFKSPLVESGYKTQIEDIRTLKDDPEKIVRVSSHYNPNNLQPLYARHKKVIDRLTVYGFNVPNMDIVIGPNEDAKHARVYIVTDRIHGPELKDKQFSPAELPAAKETLDSFFTSMTQYYWDVSRQGGNYNDDLAQHNTQFIWGRRKGEIEDKIYLVDLGEQTELHELDAGSNNHLLRCLYYEGVEPYGHGLWEDITYMERKHHIRLDGARKKLGEFMDDLLSRGPLSDLDIEKASSLKRLAESVPREQ